MSSSDDGSFSSSSCNNNSNNSSFCGEIEVPRAATVDDVACIAANSLSAMDAADPAAALMEIAEGPEHQLRRLPLVGRRSDKADDADDEDSDVEAAEISVAPCDAANAGSVVEAEALPESASATAIDYTERLLISKEVRIYRDGQDCEAMEPAVITRTMYSSAEAAVSRTNERRSRYQHCQSKPHLTLSTRLMLKAHKHASWLAQREDSEGLTTDLLGCLGHNSMTNTCKKISDDHVEIETRRFGLLICRLETRDLQALALESIDYWYQFGECYPYEQSTESLYREIQYRPFAQLLDTDCQFMGWGSAATASAGARNPLAYAVALFDTVVSSTTLDCLQPPVAAATAAAAAAATAPAPAKWLTERLSSDECVTVSEWLRGVRALRAAVRAEAETPPDRQPASSSSSSSKEWATAASYFIFSSADSAARRVNQLRWRHPQSRGKPLAVSSRLVQLANKAADELAAQEERRLAFTGALEKLTEAWAREHQSGQLGMAVCRLVPTDFKDLPAAVVNYWYSGGDSYPYGNQQWINSTPMQQTRYRRFVQLLDPNSRHMGWGAALSASSGAVYAVALFDSVACEDPRCLETLMPPMEESADAAAAAGQEVLFDFIELGSMDCGLLAQLDWVRNLFAAKPLPGEPETPEHQQLSSDLELAAELAVSRVNHLRWRYRHCQNWPLALNRHLCGFAAARANELAAHEDRSDGGVTRQLLAALQDSVMVFPGANGQRLGFVACRLTPQSQQCPELLLLPIRSVNYWYKRGAPTYPFGKPEAAVQEAKYRHFTQLVDPNSRHMGWAAAVAATSGAVFAVALFNSVGSTSRRCLERMRQAERRESDAALPREDMESDL